MINKTIRMDKQKMRVKIMKKNYYEVNFYIDENDAFNE